MFFIILLVAVVFSQLFLRMKIPWVVALLIGGVIIGPSGFDLFEADPTIEFLAQVGLVFLMFMAGLESRFSDIKGIKKHIAISVVFLGLLPPIVGFSIVSAFGHSVQTSILMGIIFMSSAIALLIPQLQEKKIINSEMGRIIVASTITVDALSLLALSVFLQVTRESISFLSLALYPLILLVLVLIAWLIPRIKWLTFAERYTEKQDLYEKELRFLILILVGFVVLFELVGLHAIIAAFFAGLVLSPSIKNHLLKAKLHAVSYGFLVPVFFVTMGARIDVAVFTEGVSILILAGSIVTGLIASKFIGGWFAGRLIGFNNRESAFLGTSALPQLSTALAVAFLGFGEGLLDQPLLSSIIILSIVTAMISPLIINYLSRNMPRQKIFGENKTEYV